MAPRQTKVSSAKNKKACGHAYDVYGKIFEIIKIVLIRLWDFITVTLGVIWRIVVGVVVVSMIFPSRRND